MTGTEFTNDQFKSIYPDGIEKHYWNHARNKVILRFLRESGLSGEPVIEIGGGRGVVTRFLRENKINITGVELADVLPVEGTEGYFYTGTDAFALPDSQREKFTVVLLADVIEHIKDSSAFIEKIRQNFRNLKHIVITVPARQELWTNYDVYNGHYLRYSIKELKKFISGDIRLLKAGYFNHVLYPVFWLYTRLIKSRDTELKAPSGNQIAIHRILSWVLLADYCLMPKMLPGTSIIALFYINPPKT